MAQRPAGPLSLPSETMRTAGYRAVDAVVERLETLADRPVARRWSRRELRGLHEPLPRRGRPLADVLERALREVLVAGIATDHPRFFSYVPGPGGFAGALADFLASGYNVFAGSWLAGAGATEVELVVLGWLSDLVGFPRGSGGILTSGGTQASLICIHAARMHALNGPDPAGCVYVGEETHASIVRGLAFLGFAPGQVRRIPSGADRTLDPAELSAALDRDRAGGLLPVAVVATAGTTGTGAVDPLVRLADVCGERGVWLHVDAAYGAAAVLTERGRRLLDGLERADSIALDPHKWWFQPYEAGCALVRDDSMLVRAFSLHAEYLTETRTGDDPVNFYDRGPQLTRSFRALKLWMSMLAFGLDALAEAVEHGMTLAERAQELVERRPGWEVVTPAQLGVMTFRPVRPDLSPARIDELTQAVAEATIDDGHALVLTTSVGGRPVLRLCTIHPEATVEDVSSTLDMLDDLCTRAGSGREAS